MRCTIVTLAFLLAACSKDPAAGSPIGSAHPGDASKETTPQSAAAGSTTAPTDQPRHPRGSAARGPWGSTLPDTARKELADLAVTLRKGLPKGSADYSHALALAMIHTRGTITFKQLREAVVARELPPHRLGDGYLMTPTPVPPPGVDFDPGNMPRDWAGNWGEVAMPYHLGELTRGQYDALHAAAHPRCD
jgi:hypothetical protein